MVSEHKRGVRPIVTLINQFTYAEVQFHDTPNTETFHGGFQNTLEVQVEMRYKKPYGGSARYKIWIDARAHISPRKIRSFGCLTNQSFFRSSNQYS